MNNNSLLNYYMTILEKVSFDDLLLEKEYQKALKSIPAAERPKLDRWMYKNGLSRN